MPKDHVSRIHFGYAHHSLLQLQIGVSSRVRSGASVCVLERVDAREVRFGNVYSIVTQCQENSSTPCWIRREGGHDVPYCQFVGSYKAAGSSDNGVKNGRRMR